MRFHLIDRRNDFHVAGDVDEMVGIEIRDADGAEFPFLVRFFQCAVCAITVAERLVQEHQVDVVRLQLTQALVDGSLCLFVAVVGNPYFRHKENFLATDAAFAHGITHALLVMVGLRRINHTIACTEGIRYTTFAFGGRYLIDAIAHLGHLDAVV